MNDSPIKTFTDTYGDWYCGRLTLTCGRWRLGLTQDLTSYKVGFSIGRIHIVELTLLCWSIDLVKMIEFPEWALPIQETLERFILPYP